MSISWFYGLVLLFSLAIFGYLFFQKFWLSQALIHLVMGLGLYLLEVDKFKSQGRCFLSIDTSWGDALPLFFSCTAALNMIVALSLVLVFSGVLTLIAVPLLRRYKNSNLRNIS